MSVDARIRSDHYDEMAAPPTRRPQSGVERIPFTNQDDLSFLSPMLPPDLLRFRVSRDGDTRMELVALDGRSGYVLLDAPLRAGWHSVALPDALQPGTYFVRLSSSAGRTSALVVVMR
jgi:hypothetical protein